MWVKILSVLLALLFVAAGVPKLLGLGEAAAGFEQMGFAPWFRLLVGAIELGGGLALLLPAVRFVAALALIAIMVGAVWTMIRMGQAPIPPVVVGALLALVGWKSRSPSA